MRFANGEIQASPTECACVDKATNRRIFWLDPQIPGRVYTLLKAGDISDAAAEFQQYGILPEGQIPGDDRIESVTFECDLADMVEKMLECGMDDPVHQIGNWLLALQGCSKRLGEELLKIQGEEGPPPKFPHNR
jgi:hypothetical protein